ncbi:MAG TPA: prepilin-type N-terminal cleavage/methylation domain-containing protein [Gaiellaceae bacterium]|nr:prepilin-type N-terminal cleavage/methylation domain-containing protein [Gaiellaceae bacterium]
MPAARLKNESGFGLIELLIAMTILQIALLALVSVFSSGAVAMGRASRLGVASGIADRAMEQYHALIYGQIGLNTGGTTDATYTGDSVCTGHSGTCGDISVSGCTSNPVTVVGIGTNPPNPCAMIQNVTGPDGKSYRVDTYIQNYTAPTPSGGSPPRAGKLVTIVVFDPNTKYGSARVLARESSSFDCSTQGGTTFNSGC